MYLGFYIFIITYILSCRLQNCGWDKEICFVNNIIIYDDKIYGLFHYQDSYKFLEILSSNNITLLLEYEKYYNNSFQNCYIKEIECGHNIKLQPYSFNLTCFYIFTLVISIILFISSIFD